MWIAFAIGCLILAIGNAVVTARLWRSPMWERSQQIAQTFFLWILPGGAIIVNWFVREPTRKEPQSDPTYSNDGATDYGYAASHGNPPFGS
jgi:hypothetical protein